MSTEKKLWNALRSGDKSALESIYLTYFDLLYNYGKKFSKDQSTVEDCIQELFIDLWNKRTNLSETNSIKPYLFVSLRRKILNAVKKNRKSTDQELKETHFDAELAIDDVIVLKESNSEKNKRLQSAFNNLSSRQKEILYLKFYSEMSYEEISDIMDMNYQSARNLVSRAIAKLSKLMVAVLLFFLVTKLLD